MISILLVDDQNLVQQGIKLLLSQNSEFKVVGTVTDGRSAVKQINALRPDIVLLDIEMPGMNGITATKYISHLSPKTKVIILSSHEDKKYVTQALMAGAKGYILKSSLTTDLEQSIIAVNNGYSQIESRLLAKIFDPSKIKLRRKKPSTKNLKARKTINKSQSATVIEADHKTVKNQDSEVTKTTSESDQPKSGMPQTKNEIDSSDFVVLSNPDSTGISDSIKLNKAKLANLKSVTVDSRINLVKSAPLTEENAHFNCASSSEADDETKLSSRHVTKDVINPLLPMAIVKRSTAEISSPTEDNLWHKLSELVLGKISYVQQIVNQQQLAKFSSQVSHFYQLISIQCEPLLQSSKTKIAKSWYRLSPVIKQWHQKGWLANAGLILLGIVTVVIIHFVFF